jgi:hypothetical protein
MNNKEEVIGKIDGALALKRFTVQKYNGGINSPFNTAVSRVMNKIPNMNWSFRRWCGYLKKIPVHEINSMLTSAENSHNVAWAFCGMIKRYRKEQKAIELKKATCGKLPF